MAVYVPYVPIEEHPIAIAVVIEIVVLIVGPFIAIWNTLLISLLSYVQCMIEIHNYKVLYFHELAAGKDHYKTIVCCIEDHLKIIR